jgi:hypothetical protein
MRILPLLDQSQDKKVYQSQRQNKKYDSLAFSNKNVNPQDSDKPSPSHRSTNFSTTITQIHHHHTKRPANLLKQMTEKKSKEKTTIKKE